jgi:hypothetical protein
MLTLRDPMPRFTRGLRFALPFLVALSACKDGTGSGDPVTGKDRTAPFAEITYPTAAGRSPAELHLLGRATDSVGVTRVTFQVDGGPERAFALITGSASPSAVQVSFDATVTLPAGAHRVVVHAYDAAGNRGSSPALDFQVDASAPQIQLAMPGAFTIAADTVRVRATVTDDYNLGYVDVGVGTGFGARFVAATRGKVTQFAVDTLVSLAVGANEIRVTAFDSVGNQTRATLVATRTAAASPGRFDAVFSYNQHTCGLRSGAAYCWGDGSTGQLGNGRLLSRDTPTRVEGGLTFSSLSVSGLGRSCGVTTTGEAYCWGADFYGTLGRGAPTGGMSAAPQRVASDVRFASVSAGAWGYSVCGLAVTGEAYCWGANSFGQAGVPSSTGSCELNGQTVACVASPARVQGGLRFTWLSTGGTSTCAIGVDGRAYCWGYNGMNGLLGNGETNTSHATPVAVAGDLRFTGLSVSESQACGVTTGGEVYCWGSNRGGALGDGTGENRRVPTRVASNVRFRSVGVLPELGGMGAGACAQAEDGTVYCWGAGRSVPARLEGGLVFTSLSPSHGCGVTADRTAYCWRPNSGPLPVPGEYL